MASTITASTLKVNIREDIKLNGVQQGGSHTFELNNVNEIYKRIVTCPANIDTTAARFRSDTSLSGSSLDIEDVRYIRVTNLDDSNSVNLSLQIDTGENDSGANDSATLLLEAGNSFMMGSTNDGIAVSSDNNTVITDLVDLESILIDPSANAVDVEIFIASV
jgi:hypothetical protein